VGPSPQLFSAISIVYSDVIKKSPPNRRGLALNSTRQEDFSLTKTTQGRECPEVIALVRFLLCDDPGFTAAAHN
jgi:hypothetical protein